MSPLLQTTALQRLPGMSATPPLHPAAKIHHPPPPPPCSGGQVLILAWCANQRCLEVVWKIASQLCLAYRCEGGRTLVVLCEREKLEMEQLFRRVLPDAERYGSRFVFRQVPPPLQSVASAAPMDVGAAGTAHPDFKWVVGVSCQG